MLTTGIATKEESQEFICHYIKALDRRDRPDTLNLWVSQVMILHAENISVDTLEGYCKPRSNDTEAETAYKQLVQSDLSLPQYTEKCKKITAACNFGAVNHKCHENAILLRLRKQKVYEMYI